MEDEVDLLYDDEDISQPSAVDKVRKVDVVSDVKSSGTAQTSSFQQKGTPANLKSSAPVVQLDSSPPTIALYVSDLSWWTSDKDLENALAGYAKNLKSIIFNEFKVNGKSKGIAYIEFDNSSVAPNARKALAEKYFHGKRPYVCYVHPSQIGQPFIQHPKDSLNADAWKNPPEIEESGYQATKDGYGARGSGGGRGRGRTYHHQSSAR